MNQQNEQFIAARIEDIKRLSAVLDGEETQYLNRIEAVRFEYQNRIKDDHAALVGMNNELLSYLKKNRRDIFPGKTDRVSITGGVLLKHVKDVVRKARHITVDFLRISGLESGIRTEESVNWAQIETWDEGQLAQIGTERTQKESFAYELTEAK